MTILLQSPTISIFTARRGGDAQVREIETRDGEIEVGVFFLGEGIEEEEVVEVGVEAEGGGGAEEGVGGRLRGPWGRGGEGMANISPKKEGARQWRSGRRRGAELRLRWRGRLERRRRRRRKGGGGGAGAGEEARGAGAGARVGGEARGARRARREVP